MMKEQKLLAVLRLQKSKAIGSILAKKLIVANGDVEQVFREKKSVLQKINGLGSNAIAHLFDNKNLLAAEQELNYILKTSNATRILSNPTRFQSLKKFLRNEQSFNRVSRFDL